MARKRVIPLLCLMALAGCGNAPGNTGQARASADVGHETQPPLPDGAVPFGTRHYRLQSSATPEQTKAMAAKLEILYQSYVDFFSLPAVDRGLVKLEVVLYRDREQFKAHNRSSPWAEAYYLPPRCHAYSAADDRNPHHWMIHEAAHQLSRQVAKFPRIRWADEGIASYFGSSAFESDRLLLGVPDESSYPIWWLDRLGLSGDMARDIAGGRFIPLRAIITGQGGPDFNQKFNLYYVEYWSLVHFLLNDGNGRHAQAFRQLLRDGATLDNFERRIGPINGVEREWYAYLSRMAGEQRLTRLRALPASP